MEGLTPVETTVSTSVSLNHQRLYISIHQKFAMTSPYARLISPSAITPIPPTTTSSSLTSPNRGKMRLTIFNFMIATLSDYQCPRLALNSVLSLLVGRKKLAYGGSLLSKIFPYRIMPSSLPFDLVDALPIKEVGAKGRSQSWQHLTKLHTTFYSQGLDG